MGTQRKEEDVEEDVGAKIEKYEAYLNETLRRDLRLCLEQRDRIYTEQADLLGKDTRIHFSLFFLEIKPERFPRHGRAAQNSSDYTGSYFKNSKVYDGVKSRKAGHPFWPQTKNRR
jgi:hypothetical protein